MNKRVDIIIHQAQKLSAEERAELLARLPNELGKAGAEHESSGRVASERAAEIDRGEVELLAWDDVLAGLGRC